MYKYKVIKVSKVPHRCTYVQYLNKCILLYRELFHLFELLIIGFMLSTAAFKKSSLYSRFSGGCGTS